MQITQSKSKASTFGIKIKKKDCKNKKNCQNVLNLILSTLVGRAPQKSVKDPNIKYFCETLETLEAIRKGGQII